jgi:SAM-dependent MidA family methyltransferase
MFGEMIAVWIMTALKNYNPKDENSLLGDLQTINLVEIGPGTGIMMTDIFNTLK